MTFFRRIIGYAKFGELWMLWMVWLECTFGVCIHVWLLGLESNEYVNIGVLSWVLMIVVYDGD